MRKIFLSITVLLCIGSIGQNINVALQGQLTFSGQSLANIWGYTAGGKEYALVGVQNGIAIVDVTNPVAPNLIVQIPGPNSIWHEVRTYKNYAYAVSEGGGGVQIIDLTNLPGSNVVYHNYTGDGVINGQLGACHALQVDSTKKYLYIYGSDNLANGGAIALDLNSNPYNPTYAGQFNSRYVHDGYADNDTLYAGAINDGKLAIIDFSNKNAPVEISSVTTPGSFTHNSWLSSNKKTVFTTDEVPNSFLTAYDITNVNNITYLDKIQSNPGSNSYVHNTHNNNDWAVTSWYRDGFTIVDAHRPTNLIQVGNYDTYPQGSGNGEDGAWGVYPYFPSGTIVVSDINNGLFVFSANYVRACYLEGIVMDSSCNQPLQGVTVTIQSAANAIDITTTSGNYATGYYLPGTYTVTFSKPGYATKTITGINLSAGNVTNLNVTLYSSSALTLSGHTQDAGTSGNLANASVVLVGTSNYNFITDAIGNFNSCGVISGTYTIYVSQWGYQTICQQGVTINIGNSNLNFALQKGYYDDFVTDEGWTVSGISPNAWERGVPVQTNNGAAIANPGADVIPDCGNMCYVTDNGGGGPWDNDVDAGYTILSSPIFDLTSYSNAYIDYYRWFYNGGTANGPPDDTMKVTLYNGITSVVLETILPGSTGNSSWVKKSFKVSSYITPTANMQIKYYIVDAPPGNIVEGGVDKFYVIDSAATGITEINKTSALQLYPNPSKGEFFIYSTEKDKVVQAEVYNTLGLVVRSTEPILVSENQYKIKLGNLSQGVYLLKIKTETEELIKQIIITDEN
jgi:choice-of-anchor B domain-containing protein